MRRHSLSILPLMLTAFACGTGIDDDGALVRPDAGTPDAAVRDGGAKQAPALYAAELVEFDPGDNAGYGADALPDVALGPPVPGSGGGGSLDVVSLGVGGSITLGFGGRRIVDGPGADFIVFENPFWIQGDMTNPFKELALVSVSTDAVTWHDFSCDPAGDGAGMWQGCAGWRPTIPYAVATHEPLDPEMTGGDTFDLAELGLREASYVRITDLSVEGAAPTAGFDLDAVGAVYLTH